MKRKLSSILIVFLIGIITLIGLKIYKNAPEGNNIYGETEIAGLEVNDLVYEYGYCQTTGGDPYICVQRFGEYIRSVTIDYENADGLESISLYYGNPSLTPENQKVAFIDKEYGTTEIKLYKNASNIRIDLNPFEGEQAVVKINAIKVNTTPINVWMVSMLLMAISGALIILADIYSKNIFEWAIKSVIIVGTLVGTAFNLPSASGYTFWVILLYALIGGIIILINTNNPKGERIFWGLTLGVVLIILCIEAVSMPYNYGPDEDMHMDVCRFIYNHHSLPDARDPEIINEMFGFSYALFPITSFIISGIFMIVGESIVAPDRLFVAARMANVVFSLTTIVMLIAISKKLFIKPFDKLFVLSICFLPQFLFVSAYINSDAFGLMCVALITWLCIKGREQNWNIQSCIALGLSIGLCLISYYNCYGMIVVAAGFALGTFVKDKSREKAKTNDIVKGLFLCICITIFFAIVVSAWWFVRNGILYDGDIIGFATKDKLQEIYAWEEMKPAARVTMYSSGVSLYDMLIDKEWIVKSCRSYIMSYGYMSVWLKDWAYIVAAVAINVMLLANLLPCKEEQCVSDRSNSKLLGSKYLLNDIAINLSMIGMCIITIMMSLVYSYFSDYQPQGRYLLPMFVGFAYLLIRGLEKLWLKTKDKIGDISWWIFAGGIIALEIASLYIGIFMYADKVI